MGCAVSCVAHNGALLSSLFGKKQETALLHFYARQRVGLAVTENIHLPINQHLADGGICSIGGVAYSRRYLLEGSTYGYMVYGQTLYNCQIPI